MLAPRRLALALLAALPATAIAQGFEYAPSTSQYRITSASKGAQEVMGQRNEFEQSSKQLVSIGIVRPVKDTLSVTVVLDSINIVGPMGMTPPGLDKLPGTKVVSKVSPAGVVYSAQGPDSTVPNAKQLTDEMSRVLPRIRVALAPGATWSDTMDINGKMGELDTKRHVIATYTVVGDSTVAADKAWKISRETHTTISGSGNANGQPMTLEGTSAGKGTLLISQKNVFGGMQNEEQSNIKILLTATGMEVAITSTATTNVEKVK